MVSEGPIISSKVLDSIRDWRKRLYRAFKSKKPKAAVPRIVESSLATDTRAASASQIVDFKDLTPLVIDKNRQVLLSRKEANWESNMASAKAQTFGRDPNGKIVRLFGTETSGYRSAPQGDSPPDQLSNDYLPVSPISSNRKAYRTPGGRNVVYIPAPPTLAALPSSPVTAPPPTLPSLITFPFPQNTPGFPEQQYTTTPMYNQPFNSYTNAPAPNFAGANFNLPAQQPIELPTIAPNYASQNGDNDMDGGFEDDNFQQQGETMNTVSWISVRN
ncbi:hypothetical protein ANCCAN_22543 [Ancylostoma caninum]|uniref:Uncharacterized protein n=1 Tax=Ancylostoma caninum TaxID=29170 RepID=A0A368FKY3_ANCCA|nr:hypothetical protein ANCCAN_22543 [Ancylostoma caninum]